MSGVLRVLLAVVLSALRPLGARLLRVARPPAAADDESIAPPPGGERTLHRTTGGPAWAERAVAGALAVAAGCFVGFLVLLLVDPDTQLLGLVGGLGLAAVAGGLIVAGLLVVPQERAEEPRTATPEPPHQRGLVEDLRRGADGVTRRRLLTVAAGSAGAAFGAAAIAGPLSALGPGPGVLNASPWRAGVPLVDEDGRAITAAMVPVGEFVTAFPAGADRRELGSPLMVVRVEPDTLELPAERRGWAPDGLLAFSKICTHAGCAVSLFRYPVDERLSSGPALVCPCHYSTFDVRRAAAVVFGPAGRPLPQLPLRVTADGRLVAAGPLSGSVGPAWWGTERS